MKMVVLGTKVTDEFKDEVTREAAKNGKTTSDFLRMCVEEVVNGHYQIQGDKLVPTKEYLDVLRPEKQAIEMIPDDSDYTYLGFDSVVRLLRKKKYPDNAIKRLVEQLKEQISDGGDYNPRRTREDWC